MREIPRAAVIATHNRPAELRRCVEAIAPQVDLVVVVDNASDPPISMPDLLDMAACAPQAVPHLRLSLITDGEQPPNLSRLWNVGLDRARRVMFHHNLLNAAVPQCDLAVLNDDAIPPAGWFDAVAGAMRTHNAYTASSAPFNDLAPGMSVVWEADAPMGVHTRLAGWAMMLRGEWEGARLDERFRWWCGDDDISHRARLAGGLLHLGGYPVPNTLSDTSTVGVLAEQSARDMQAFVDTWGKRPW